MRVLTAFVAQFFVTLFVTPRPFAGAKKALRTQISGLCAKQISECIMAIQRRIARQIDNIRHETCKIGVTKVTKGGVERCGSGHFALKSSKSKGKSLKSIGLEAFEWQREKDSNPHIRSQSPLCYLYTIPLNAKLLYMLFGICQAKIFRFYPRACRASPLPCMRS